MALKSGPPLMKNNDLFDDGPADFSRTSTGFERLIPLSPSSPRTRRSPARRNSADSGLSRVWRVLYAEGNSAERATGAAILGKLGFTVAAAATGDEAWRLLADEAQSFDLALLDVHMPGMTGLDVLSSIRRLPRLQNLAVVSSWRLPLLFACFVLPAMELCYPLHLSHELTCFCGCVRAVVSSPANASLGFRCLSHGADDFVVKPLRVRKLTTLQSLVQSKASNQHSRQRNDSGASDESARAIVMANAMGALQKRIAAAVDTPIQTVADTLESLAALADTPPDIARVLRSSAQSLRQTTIASQGFESIVASSADMDADTKAWILDQVRSSRATKASTPPGSASSILPSMADARQEPAASATVAPSVDPADVASAAAVPLERAAEAARLNDVGDGNASVSIVLTRSETAEASSRGLGTFAATTESGAVALAVGARASCDSVQSECTSVSISPPPTSAVSRSISPLPDGRHLAEQESAEASAAIIDELCSFETFHILNFSEDDLALYALEMLKYARMPELCSCNVETIRAFVAAVREGYRENPYHNWRHAVDVMQFTFLLLERCLLKNHLLPLDVVGLLLASLCHDVDHPGLNNNYQVNTVSELAIRYSDMSVLENHHAAKTFQLALAQRALFEGMSTAQFKYLRALIVRSILATDLALHAERMRWFDERVRSFDRTRTDDRMLLCELIMKAADISNPARPFVLSKYWSDVLIEENLAQGVREAKLGLPVSPFMDPQTLNQCKMSTGFIDFFVVPTFRALEQLSPEVGTIILPSLTRNRMQWQEMLDLDNKLAARAVTPGEQA